MKKIISVALLLALCLCMFAGCASEPVNNETTVSDLDNAKAYLFNMYKGDAGKDEANKIVKDKDVTSVVTIGGVGYAVEWAVEITAGAADAVVIGESDTANSVKVDITEQPEEQVEFTLTGTIKDAEGQSVSVSFKFYTPAVEKPDASVTTLTVVDAPVAGVPFKLGMFQANLGKTLYFAGTTANKDYYMATTEDVAAATDVTLEEVEGGYLISFMADGVKTYLDVYKSGDYINLRLTAEPTAVWTWDAEFKSFVADVEGTAYYCGTYKEYDTLSASKYDYIATSFPCNLYASEVKTAAVTVAETAEVGVTYKLGMFQANLGKTLYFAGTTANKDYYMATTEDVAAATDVTLEEVEGGYLISFMADGVKTYLDVYKSGDYINLRLTAEPTAVWTWDAEFKSFVADVEGTAYYCGTYKEYDTLSASKYDYIATSFPCNLFVVG